MTTTDLTLDDVASLDVYLPTRDIRSGLDQFEFVDFHEEGALEVGDIIVFESCGNPFIARVTETFDPQATADDLPGGLLADHDTMNARLDNDFEKIPEENDGVWKIPEAEVEG